MYQSGQLVGHIREFSDMLLDRLLKARRPNKYRDRVGIDQTNRVIVELAHKVVTTREELTDFLNANAITDQTGEAIPSSQAPDPATP